MEWEAILMRIPDGIGFEELPKNWQPPSIGNSVEVKSLLEAALPHEDHIDGHSRIEGDGFWVEFDYEPSEPDELVRAVVVRSSASLGAVSILRLASETLDCRLLDLQTGRVADFGEQTEASINDFIELRRRMKQEKRWAFVVTVVLVATFHVLQDSGTIPVMESLSKPAIASYGFVGLIFLNAIVFLFSVVVAMRKAKQFKSESTSQEEQEEIEEAILLPAFQGEGSPPSFIARFLHIPVAALLGMIAGSILAWVLSLVLF